MLNEPGINIDNHYPEIIRDVHIVNKTTFANYHQVMLYEREMLSIEIKFHAPVKAQSMSEVAFHLFGGYLAQGVGYYDLVKKFIVCHNGIVYKHKNSNNWRIMIILQCFL